MARTSPSPFRRRAGDSLQVEAQRGWPVRLEWNGRRESVVEVLDIWVVEGGWWREPHRRIYFRIRTPHRVLDVYVRDGRWALSRVWD